MKKFIKIAFIVTLFTLCIITSCNRIQEQKSEQKSTIVHYLLANVEKDYLKATVKLPAQLAAYREISIFPKVNGFVKKVYVDIGSQVKEGQLVMTLEAPELEQAVMQAKEKYNKTKVDFLIVKENYQRLQQASQTTGAVSPLDLSTAKARVDADSILCNQEKANWEMQKTMLSYLNITAPFSGVVTERNVHEGTLASATAKDKPLLELKQIQNLRLLVDVPENFLSIKERDSISFYITALNNKKMTALISRKADNVNAQYRFERVEADVKNDGSLSPGMYADVVLKSNNNKASLVVPASAVVTSTERKYVLVVRNNKAIKVDIIALAEVNGKIAIDGLLQQGEKVIINANDEIKEGIIVN
jgi:RND family efflux transporter MFP subunit